MCNVNKELDLECVRLVSHRRAFGMNVGSPPSFQQAVDRRGVFPTSSPTLQAQQIRIVDTRREKSLAVPTLMRSSYIPPPHPVVHLNHLVTISPPVPIMQVSSPPRRALSNSCMSFPALRSVAGFTTSVETPTQNATIGLVVIESKASENRAVKIKNSSTLCEVCGTNFSRKCNMQRHMLNKHGDKEESELDRAHRRNMQSRSVRIRRKKDPVFAEKERVRSKMNNKKEKEKKMAFPVT